MRRWAAAGGVVLLVLGLLTGVPLVQAMTHHIAADLHQILAAHFIAVLGCLWLIALGGVTAVKSLFHVSGVGLTGDHAAAVAWAYGLLGARSTD